VTAYARLEELARHEHELVLDGRLAELPALYAEREQLVAALPPQPPREARPHLERALELSQATEETAQIRLAKARADLGALSRHRRVASAYAGVAPALTLDATA
jgi:hypothetical protein